VPANPSAPVRHTGRALRRVFVSGFVLFSYIAYAVHERFAAPAPAVAAQPPLPRSGEGLAKSDPAPAAAAPKGPAATATPQVATAGLYKDGTYTGAKANAFYGQVQVQVVIAGGKIASVNFLDYPRDRRTSARINSFAIPFLQSEAIQAQSANVDLISGATLTSEAFAVSLQSALNGARS
jgi:uncharacterized protein with FMN-binding domain